MSDFQGLKDYLIDQKDYPLKEEVIGICKIKLNVNKQPKSSLNLSFGSGRMNQLGKLKSRSWFEVELSASAAEIKSEFYPQSEYISLNRKTKKGSFTAYVEEDGNYFCLEMKVHADNGKNISSTSGGRKTLGHIIKGKLVRNKILPFGDLITSKILDKYGNDVIELHKLRGNRYFIKF